MGNIFHQSKHRGHHYILQDQHNMSILAALKQNRWKELRSWKGNLTQKELAKRAGFSASWLSRVEHGLIVPNIIQFIWLAQSLNLGASVNIVYDQLWFEIGKALPASTKKNHYDPSNHHQRITQ